MKELDGETSAKELRALPNEQPSFPLSQYIRRLPKAELHLHLEGSVTPRIFLQLCRKYREEHQDWSEERVSKELFCYRDFHHFLEIYKLVCTLLREPDDYLELLDGLRDYLLEENIRYAEILYTPAIPWKCGRDAERILAALLDRSRQIGETSGVKLNWILDSVRQFGVEPAWKTVELAGAHNGDGVVAVGMGGDECSLSLSEYTDVFAWAKAHQLFVHIHAGEIGGPEQVWDALNIIGTNRIGHGIQAARDARLLEHLRVRAVGLDVCLTSNLKTGAWRPISDNPFGILYRRGIPVTLNSDDPGLFQTTLSREYELAARSFHLSIEELHRIVLQAVHCSFLPYAEKMLLMQDFQKEIQELIQTLPAEVLENASG